MTVLAALLSSLRASGIPRWPAILDGSLGTSPVSLSLPMQLPLSSGVAGLMTLACMHKDGTRLPTVEALRRVFDNHQLAVFRLVQDR